MTAGGALGSNKKRAESRAVQKKYKGSEKPDKVLLKVLKIYGGMSVGSPKDGEGVENRDLCQGEPGR
jgi:hypothetical protein